MSGDLKAKPIGGGVMGMGGMGGGFRSVGHRGLRMTVGPCVILLPESRDAAVLADGPAGCSGEGDGVKTVVAEPGP